MVRETSIAAYNAIKDNGLLSGRRFEVYEFLFQHGPCTGNELLAKMKLEIDRFNGNAPNVVTRLGELRDFGVVRELGTRKCNITGMTVTVWDVTDKLPTKAAIQPKRKCTACAGRGYFVI
jgi:hypothetical protein